MHTGCLSWKCITCKERQVCLPTSMMANRSEPWSAIGWCFYAKQRRTFRKMRILKVDLVAGFCAFSPAERVISSANAPTFRVIVHLRNPETTLNRKFVADVFLKRSTRWPDGEVIRPVDLRIDAPARRRFSEEVIKRSVEAVKSYWQQQVFTGRDVPPP